LSIARNNLVDPADISVAFGDVGGMDEIKSEIYDLVVLPLLRPDLFDCESGLVNPPKGILLYG
jgi:ATP-dependent 26S proteasome regulatory subunit